MDTSYSRYEEWVENGNFGSYEDFLASMQKVVQGPPGKDGKDGKDFDPEIIGQEVQAGISSVIGAVIAKPVEKVVTSTIEGTFQRLYESGAITGPKGKDGRDGIDGKDGVDGKDGKNGLNGLMGPKGDRGEPGEKGDKGDKGDRGDDGTPGKSAYELWLDSGNEGSEEDYHQAIAKNAAYWGGVIIGGNGGSGSSDITIGDTVVDGVPEAVLFVDGDGNLANDSDFTYDVDTNTLNVPNLTINGSGAVVGPASSTDNAIARYDDTTGKIIQNSSILISDTGLLQFGTLSTNPALKVVGTELQVRRADDTGNLSFRASIINATSMRTNDISNTSSTNNSRILLAVTGTTITRNVADANTALIVSQENATSTGDIFEANNSTGTVFMVGQTGATTIQPNSLTGTAATSSLSITQTWNTTGTPTAIFANITDTASNASSLLMDLQTGGVSNFRVSKGGTATARGIVSLGNVTLNGDVQLSKTITPAGTTGARTINNNSGSVNFAAGAMSLVVTNNLVTTNSVIHCTIASNDSTMTSVQVVAGAGSFTIYAQPGPPAAETRVNFLVTN